MKTTWGKRREAGTEILHGGARVELTSVGGDATSPEENADLPEFTPERARLLLQVFYEDFPHHNGG